MDKFIDSRFERVEKALATLINSISTYNPSPALANDLVKADTELSEGLQQCERRTTLSLSEPHILTQRTSISPPKEILPDTFPAQHHQCARHPDPRDAYPANANAHRADFHPVNQLPREHQSSLVLRAALLRPPNQQVYHPQHIPRARSRERSEQC